MFGNSEFYYETLRRYTVVFGTMFNNIVIKKRNQDGTTAKRIKVPIAYGPKEKYLTRLTQDPGLDRKYAITLPRMSFEMTSFQYAAERHLASTRNFRLPANTASSASKLFVPVPYDIGFRLEVMVLNAEDGTQIIEQILPFFTPDWTNTIQLLDDPVLSIDTPLVFTGMSTTDTYEGGFEQRRALIHSLDFIMKGHIIGPVKTKKSIRVTKTNFFVDTTDAELGTSNTEVATIQVQPGLDANGDPTSNAALTVAANTIFEDDNWDYIVTITDPVPPS